MTRAEILEQARKCVCGDREQDYGSPENNFRLIATLWEAYMKVGCISLGADVCILPEDVAAMLALLKIARIASGHAKEDNWIDLAGYAACGGEIQPGGTHETEPEAGQIRVAAEAIGRNCPHCGAEADYFYVERGTGDVVGCDGCIDTEVFAPGYCRGCGEMGVKEMYFDADDHGCVGCSHCTRRVSVDDYDQEYGDCEANYTEDEAVERFYENR